MPRMADSTSVAANSTSANVLSGKLHEFLKRHSALTLLALASATGLYVTFIVGDEVVIDDSMLPFGAGTLSRLDHVIAEHGGLAGERITLKFRNSTAGAITVNWALDVETVG